MPRPLRIADPENATIEELKQVSRVGSNQTATRCTAIQRTTTILMMDNGSWHKRKTTHWHNWQPMYLPPDSPDFNPIKRIWLTIKTRGFNNHVCKNEQKQLERLDQAILDVSDNPDKTLQTTAIGTLF